jgi:hypothetical protein
MERDTASESWKADPTVMAWLLDADPAIRWQVLGDLSDTPADEVAAERARVAREGWGAQLLGQQAEDGTWGGAAWNGGWDSTMHVLMLLRDFGLDPACAQARHALASVREQVTWRGCGPQEANNNRFFEGETEACINGQVAAVGAYFGQDVLPLIERLLGEQLADGGWNCDAPNQSNRSSFNTTICVLEALLAYEQRFGSSPQITQARQAGENYLLERQLFCRKSTGEPIEHDRKSGSNWLSFAFPSWWHYDLLRGLEYMRSAGIKPDQRVDKAIGVLLQKRTGDGKWLLDAHYAGIMPIELGESLGQASRWNTLRALRVAKWYLGASSNHL